MEEFGNFLNAKKKRINNYVYNKQKYYFVLKTISLFVFWGIFLEAFAWDMPRSNISILKKVAL